MNNHYYNPVHTVCGNGCIAELPRLLREVAPNGCPVLLLSWSETVAELPVFQMLMQEPDFEIRPFCFSASNPTVGQLFEAYQETKEYAPEIVVAVGGGSVLDVGKSLCCLYGKELSAEDDVRALIEGKQYGAPAAKWIGIPTTAGTGSEVTCWATIWDPQKNAKRSVDTQDNYAYAAIADPQLTAGMPVSLAVSSALDAVAHAVESYWAKATNAVSKELALGAVRMMMAQMDALLDGDSHAQEIMAQGSMLAGMAFSNTRTTACHSISYPLTMYGQIPHGTAVSMLLAPVLTINQDQTEDMQRLFAALGVEHAEELRERIHMILRRAGIPCTLQEWKIDREKLPVLAALGITKGRADNNPVELTPKMVEAILETIYEA